MKTEKREFWSYDYQLNLVGKRVETGAGMSGTIIDASYVKGKAFGLVPAFVFQIKFSNGKEKAITTMGITTLIDHGTLKLTK
jgi:hypothetical protein